MATSSSACAHGRVNRNLTMKKLLLSTAALAALTVSAVAADLPARVATPAPAPVYVPISDWTGFYLGIVGGYAFGKTSFTPTGELTDLPKQHFQHDGGLVGGQVGFNYQFVNRFVVGGVADWSWASIKGSVCVESTSGGCDGSPDDSFAHGKVNWLATFRGNVGYAVSNDFLLYISGGLAVAGTQARITQIFSGAPDITDKATLAGWTAGAGIKWKFARTWSIGAEYLYVDLGRHGYTFTNSSIPIDASDGITADVRTHLHVIRGSLSYEFGAGSSSVVAKY
jgi:outer membrane immunogenic protein